MVKHVIIWNLKAEFSDEEKLIIKQNAKQNLEALVGKIDGLVDLKIQTEFLSTSTGEMMLDSTFVDFDALRVYATHPLHQEAANRYVRPFTASRSCVDFEI